MYSGATEQYAEAVASVDHDVTVCISIGSGIDTTARDDVVSIDGGLLPMSNTAQASDAVYTLEEGLATFEGDGIPTARSAGMTAPPLTAVDYPPETGLWSDAISDAVGAIDWSITVTLSATHESALRIYTSGPSITSGTVTFIDGSEEAVCELECLASYAQVSESHTYDTIVINVTGISEPYHHVRVAEIEYGASEALSTDRLGEEVTIIRELDPTETSMPLSELDFSLINIDGHWDSDNPDTLIGMVAPGTPVEVSFTVSSGGRAWTVPMGRFVIDSLDSDDAYLKVTAYDDRWRLSDVYTEWTLTTDASLGDQLDDLFGTYGLAHTIDAELFDIVPSESYEFGEDTSYLDDLLTIGQRYAVYFIPDRDMTIRITTEWPSGDGGTVPVDGEYSWPSPVTFTSYNHVKVRFGSQLYSEVDLREDVTSARSTLSVSNALVTDETTADGIRDRIASRLCSERVSCDWTGDPAVDEGDALAIPGRWTQESPVTYTSIYSEIVFDGSLRMTTEAVR